MKGATLHSHCSGCRLTLQRNPGDPWAFLIVIDRIVVVFPIVAAIYFGFFNSGIVVFVAFAVSLIGFFVVTTPNRYGICVALDYLTRVYWSDPSDVLPELPPVREEAVGGRQRDGMVRLLGQCGSRERQGESDEQAARGDFVEWRERLLHGVGSRRRRA